MIRNSTCGGRPGTSREMIGATAAIVVTSSRDHRELSVTGQPSPRRRQDRPHGSIPAWPQLRSAIEQRWSITARRVQDLSAVHSPVDPVMIVNRARASSAVPWNASGANGEPGATSMPDTTNPTSRAAAALIPHPQGSVHILPDRPRLVVIGTSLKPSRSPPVPME